MSSKILLRVCIFCLRSLIEPYMGAEAQLHKVDFPLWAGSITAMIALLPFPDISPELFSVTLFGVTLALRWYALAYIVGILIGWWLVVRAVKQPAIWARDTPPATTQQVEDLLFWVIAGVIGGGRLGYVLFYQPGAYASDPLSILRVWEGGMSFHGGALGVILAARLGLFWPCSFIHGATPCPGCSWGIWCVWVWRRGCCWGGLRILSMLSYGGDPRICLGASPFRQRQRSIVLR
jgi:uncharacterized protein YneF (UPF0154 family)